MRSDQFVERNHFCIFLTICDVMQSSADEILFRRFNSLDLYSTSFDLYLFVMNYEINVMQHLFSIGKKLLFIDTEENLLPAIKLSGR